MGDWDVDVVYTVSFETSGERATVTLSPTRLPGRRGDASRPLGCLPIRWIARTPYHRAVAPLRSIPRHEYTSNIYSTPRTLPFVYPAGGVALLVRARGRAETNEPFRGCLGAQPRPMNVKHYIVLMPRDVCPHETMAAALGVATQRR